MRALASVIGVPVVLAALAAGAAAAGEGCDPAMPATAVVERVVDAGTIALKEGTLVRLAGVVAPEGRTGDLARQRLLTLLNGKPVLLGDRQARPDRYGRTAAQIYVGADRTWVQAVLLRAGLLRVFTLRDERACAAALLEAEAEGRAAGAGLWADPQFAIRMADDPTLPGDGGRFQIVEGEVLSTGRTAAAVYLNFGRNRSTDFTVTVNMADTELSESEGPALDALKGRRVRVRGWLFIENGPAMRVDHPEQIELTDR
jgi:micrococcal nuclease